MVYYTQVMNMGEPRSYQSWTISDEFWDAVKDLIPKKERDSNKEYRRKPGGGRKPLDARRVLEGILYTLRNGCLWKAIPKEYGASSSIHQYFQQWLEAGFFVQLWQAGLALYDELEGIGWEWQSGDASMVKAPLALEAVGANPTDRGKKWDETHPIGRKQRRPPRRRNIRSQCS